MSVDTVDDLQAAEDYALTVRARARAVVEYLTHDSDPGDSVDWQELMDLVALLDSASAEAFCRPSCQAGECDDDCGCLAHDDDEPHHAPDTD
jgi:hypothetical protein